MAATAFAAIVVLFMACDRGSRVVPPMSDTTQNAPGPDNTVKRLPNNVPPPTPGPVPQTPPMPPAQQ